MSSTVVSTDTYVVFGTAIPKARAQAVVDAFVEYPTRAVRTCMREAELRYGPSRGAGWTTTESWIDELSRLIREDAAPLTYDVFGYEVPAERAVELLNALGPNPTHLSRHLLGLGLRDFQTRLDSDAAVAFAGSLSGQNRNAHRAYGFAWKLFSLVYPDDAVPVIDAELVEPAPAYVDVDVYGATIAARHIPALLEAFAGMSGRRDGPSLQRLYWGVVEPGHSMEVPLGMSMESMRAAAGFATAGAFGDELRRVVEESLHPLVAVEEPIVVSATPVAHPDITVFGYVIPGAKVQSLLDIFDRDKSAIDINPCSSDVGRHLDQLHLPSFAYAGGDLDAWRAASAPVCWGRGGNGNCTGQRAFRDEVLNQLGAIDELGYTIPRGSLAEFEDAVRAKVDELGNAKDWCRSGRARVLRDLDLTPDKWKDQTPEKVALARKLIEVGEKGVSDNWLRTNEELQRVLADLGVVKVAPAPEPEPELIDHAVYVTVRVNAKGATALEAANGVRNTYTGDVMDAVPGDSTLVSVRAELASNVDIMEPF